MGLYPSVLYKVYAVDRRPGNGQMLLYRCSKASARYGKNIGAGGRPNSVALRRGAEEGDRGEGPGPAGALQLWSTHKGGSGKGALL